MSESSGDWLHAQWRSLLAPFGVPSKMVEDSFDQICRDYYSLGRYYHTLDHIVDVLRAIEELNALAINPVVVRLAAWYHDCIYDPRAADNEEQSAEVARTALEWLSLSLFADPVSALILATKGHCADSPDAAVLLDADLAILGAEPSRYDEYARAIRQEFDWVPEAHYRSGRAAVLRSFVDRERIYITDVMRGRLEQPARTNLARELSSLSPG